MKVEEPLFSYIDTSTKWEVINGDALNELKKIEKETFDLIITSPPYNIGKSYETKTTIESYKLTFKKKYLNYMYIDKSLLKSIA